MKKIIISVLVMLLSLISFSNCQADSSTDIYPQGAKKLDNKMYKLYKQAILTRFQIQKDYSNGKQINSRIEKYFINLYFKSDRNNELKNIEKKMGLMIEKYDNKTLSLKQKKALNIMKNLYYRAVIELNK